jgi:predicted RNA binding protein YcfA (HicA-like mRNA interferase family)
MDWSTKDVLDVLYQLGFAHARDESHTTLTKAGHPRTVSVPRDRKAIAKSTLGIIWRQAGITGPQALKLRKKK